MSGRVRTAFTSGVVLALAMSVWPDVIPSHGQSPEVSCRSCQAAGMPCELSFGASGTVTDGATGLPVAGAVVTVQGLDPTFTDSDGHYAALSTRPDVCTLDYAFQMSVEAGGYRTFTQGGYFSAVAFPMHTDAVLDPEPVTVVLGSAVGMPGSQAELSATLVTRGAEVARVEHEIGIHRRAPIAASGEDPACRPGPGVADASALFVFLPRGCTPASDCERLRVTVNASAPIADGSVLYECTVEVSAEPADTCVHPVPCERVSASDVVGATVNAACTDGQVVSDVSAGHHLDVDFLVEPPRPVVGDDVFLQVAVSGPGGLPQYRLSGTDPFLDGDTSPLTDGSFGEVEYELRAVRAGTAELRMSVNYEVQMGCPGSYFFAFVTDVSEPFLLEIGGGVAPDCIGDCDGDGRVLVDEVVTCVNMGLGLLAGDACAACDADTDGVVGIGEIVQAVNIGIGRLACVADPLF